MNVTDILLDNIYNNILSYLIPYELLGFTVCNKNINNITKNLFKFYANDYDNEYSYCSRCNYIFAWYLFNVYELITYYSYRIEYNYICSKCYDKNNDLNYKQNYPQRIDRSWYYDIIKK
jgi:hypothetical protein